MISMFQEKDRRRTGYNKLFMNLQYVLLTKENALPKKYLIPSTTA